jgi:hypothetical protein
VDVAHYTFLRIEFLRAILPAALGCAGFAVMSLASGRFLSACARRRLLRPLGDHGSSELEFALALPWFLVSVLVTIQMTLMVNAMLVVDYAAFCAARSAAVWLPQTVPNEAANSIAPPDDTDSEKWSRIRRAASLSCIPISPRLSSFAGGFLQLPAAAITAEQFQALAALGDPMPGQTISPLRLGIDTLDKWFYSALFTDVSLYGQDGMPRTDFPGDTPVTARVAHKFYMNVPFAGPLMGRVFGHRYFWLIGPYYVELSSSYTLQMAHS